MPNIILINNAPSRKKIFEITNNKGSITIIDQLKE